MNSYYIENISLVRYFAKIFFIKSLPRH